MNLNTKYKLNLGTDYAQALRVFLIQSLERRQESAYYQIVQLLAARVAQKIHRKDTGEGLKLKLNVEEALAIQVVIATNTWPGNEVDSVLHYVQLSLPPLTRQLLEAPAGVFWE